MSIIFGPVASRRFGKSLGIDLSPEIKQCNYDCVYCELEPAATVGGYERILPVETVVDAVEEALSKHPDIDVLTVTANGEPTLYPHLDELMERIETIKGKIPTLILSNASTVDRPEVRRILRRFDLVKLSLDCATQSCLKRIDRMHKGIEVERIKEGMLQLRRDFDGALIIEVLVVRGINDKASEIAALNDYFLRLRPDRIDLGTIDRPPAYAVSPVDYTTLKQLAELFDPSLPVHIASRRGSQAIPPQSYTRDDILRTLSKRPLTPEDVEILMDEPSRRRVEELLAEGSIRVQENHGVRFYTKTVSDY